MTEKINRIVPLLEFVDQAERQKLSVLSRQIEDLRVQIQSINTSSAHPEEQEITPAYLAGATEAWALWKLQKTRELSIELANIAARRETQIGVVNEAVARADVARKIRSKMVNAAKARTD